MKKSCVTACPVEWPDDRGISGRIRVEWVAGSPWNRWSDAYGMGGQMTVESARLLAAVMDEAQTDFSIASIAVEKIRQGAESIAAGMHGRNHVKASFEHYDGTPMSPEEALAHQCVHAASIGKSLGQEFLLKAPAPLLEQFSAVAGNRNVADSGAMLAGLLHGFMIAFATRETEERALKAMLEVARICDEANNIRGTSFGQASE